jgi:hypothetical protein
MALLGLWSGALVRFQFDGNPTGLFCIGSLSKAATAKTGTRLWIFPASQGYDGQFYYVLAHDPLLGPGTLQHLDNPRVRAKRILLPAATYALSLGNPAWLADVYWLIVIMSAGAGAFWVARFAAMSELSEYWGVLFALTPAVLVGIERMTVDGVFAAAIVAACLFHRSGRELPFLAALAAAPLIRETGMLFTAAASFVAWREGGLRRASITAATAIPSIAWSAYVVARTEPDPTSWFGLPFSALLARLVTPFAYPYQPWLSHALALLDFLALAGTAIAIVLGFRHLRDETLISTTASLFALLAVSLSNPDVWTEVYGFGRTMSPVLLLTALHGLRNRSRWLLAPMLLVVPRTVAQMTATLLAGTIRPLITP